jgi:hypothetical protein
VTKFNDVYHQLTRQMKLIAKMQQQLAVMTARRADLPAGLAPDPVPFNTACTGSGGDLARRLKSCRPSSRPTRPRPVPTMSV